MDKTQITDGAQRPRRNPDYHMEQLDNELLLYHFDATKVVYLSETASLIWRLCDGTRSAVEIAGLLCEAFPEDAGAITDDVLATLQQFREAGCIEMV